MGTRLYEESLQLDIAMVEARTPTLDAPEGYPLPFLTPTLNLERREFRVWVLENDFLRAKVIPALGGRIWSIFDKCASREILEIPDQVVCSTGGPRGAYLDFGIQLRLMGTDRLNSLGPVHAQPEPEGDGPATLWIGDIEAIGGLSFHTALTLHGGEAALTAEFRVLNRSLHPTAYFPSVAAYLPSGQALLGGGRSASYDIVRDCGLVLAQMREPLDHSTFESGRLSLGRFGSPQTLAPRQTDQWSVRIVPFSGLGSLTEANGELAIGLGPELRVQSAIALDKGAKILLETQTGDRHEAPTSFSPGEMVTIPLSGELLNPRAVGVRTVGGDAKLVWGEGAEAGEAPEPELPALNWPTDLSAAHWKRLTFSPAHRYLAHIQLGIDAFGRHDWAEAYDRFESALLFNADDPLCWWAKSAALRLSGAEAEENSDLLNAHYLAPFEPLLRAESFLSQSQEMGKEANPLLAGLSTDDFAEVACVLIEHRLLDQAARFLDEALRHGDSFTLRYLLAFCYLSGSRLVAEAAQQVELAGRLPDEPPLPWRLTERKALARLHEDFSRNEALDRRFRLSESTS